MIRSTRAPSVPVMTEALDPRRLFASISVTGGTLVLTGDATKADTISLALSTDKKSYSATAGTQRQTLTASAIKAIRITGGSMADTITVGATITLPATIDGGAGNDTITGGGGNDGIKGGDGNDRISAGAGNDTIAGGNGDDTVNGDGGTDQADGGFGTDTVGVGLEYFSGFSTVGPKVPTGTTPPAPTTPVVTTPVPPSVPTTPTPPKTPTSPPVNSSAATPTPVITPMQTSLVAGEALFVHGLNSNYGVGSQDTAHFEWNFGDPAGAYNTLVGFNAAHAYTQAGTYTVTLKLWNQAGGFKQTTMAIRVAPSARHTIYVAANGSDGNDGSSGRPIQSFAKAAALIRGKSDVEVLFRAGDTFNVSSALEVGGANVRLGSYGLGAKPKLFWNGVRTNTDMIRLMSNSTGAVVQGLTIDTRFGGPSADRSGMPVGINVKGKAAAIRDVTFINIGYAIQTNTQPTGVLVQDCDEPTTYGLRSYLVWAQGSDFVLLGNKVANSTNEHPIRVFGVDRMLIAYNDLKNPQAYGFETSKTALNIQKGNDVYVYGNTIRGPRMQLGPLGGADGLGDKGARLNDVVLENNTFDDTILQMYTGLQHVFIRNNVWDYANNDAMTLEGYSSAYGRGIVDVNVVNNTFVNDGTQGGVVQITGSVSGIKLENNLYKAPSLVMGSKGTAAINATDMTAFKSFTSITNNVWAIPASYPSWLSSHTSGKVFALIGINQADPNNYYNIDRWNGLSNVGTDSEATVALGGSYTPAGSPTVASGIRNYPGVFGDYHGKVRPTNAAWTIGAVQV